MLWKPAPGGAECQKEAGVLLRLLVRLPSCTEAASSQQSVHHTPG